jgi:hypothetical protein
VKDRGIKDAEYVFGKLLHPDKLFTRVLALLLRFGCREVEDGQYVGCSSLGSEFESASQYHKSTNFQDNLANLEF